MKTTFKGLKIENNIQRLKKKKKTRVSRNKQKKLLDKKPNKPTWGGQQNVVFLLSFQKKNCQVNDSDSFLIIATCVIFFTWYRHLEFAYFL